METERWKEILIEWINCLKLSKSLQNIKELKRGNFFHNLQKLITKSSDVSTDPLTFIFDLFNKHYPLFTIEDKAEIHLNDLLDSDLIAITSLLMHYTCIYDRRDVLTSPLCHSLSQKTQIVIKSFLEKIDNNITREILSNIIEQCLYNKNENLTNRWLNFESSSSENSSPLQDFLRTPVSKYGRLQEKDRIITNLRTELEVERCEKIDLQEELRVQEDKIKKIENQLNQKTNEVSRLKNEVAALENRTPPHYQDVDSRELQRCLKLEIHSLEQYIQRIEDEQEEIKKEKDLSNEQVRKLETESMIWQQKFFEIEEKFELLSICSKKQEDEFKTLQVNYEELATLLEEYRTKPSNDTFPFEDDSLCLKNKTLESVECRENLACSVVEVQLQDALRLNEDFQSQNKELEDKCNKLVAQVDEVEQKLKTSEETKQELINDFENQVKLFKANEKSLEIKLTDLSQEFQNTVKQFNTTENELKLSITKSESLEKFVSEMEVKISEIEETNQQYLNKIDEMDQNLTQTKGIAENLEIHKQNLTKEVEDLTSQMKIFEANFVESQNNLIATEGLLKAKHLDVEFLQKQNSIMATKLIESLNELRIMKEENNVTKANFEELQRTIARLMVEFNIWIKKHGETVKSLENNNTELMSELQEKSTTCELLKECKNALELKNNELETILKQKQIEFKETQLHNSNLESQLQLLKKENEIVNIKLENNAKEIERLESSWAHSASELGIMIMKNEELEVNIKSLESNYMNCKNECEETRNYLNITVNDLKQAEEANQFFKSRNCELQEEISTLNSKLSQQAVDFIDISEKWNTDKNKLYDIEISYNETTSQVSELQQKLQDTFEENQNLRNNIEECEEAKRNILIQLNILEQSKNDLLLKIEQLEQQIYEKEKEFVIHEQENEEKFKLIADNNENLISKLNYVENELFEAQNTITSLTHELNSATQLVQDQKDDFSKISLSVQSLTLESQNVLKQLEEANGKIVSLEEQLLKEQISNEQLNEQNELHKLNYEEICKEYEIVCKENKLFLENSIKTKEFEKEITNKLQALQNQLDVELQHSELKKEEINDLRIQIVNKENDIERYRKIEKNLEKQMVDASSELKKHNEEMKILLQEKNIQFELLTRRNEEFLNKISVLEKELSTTKKDLKESESQLGLLAQDLQNRKLDIDTLEQLQMDKDNEIKDLRQENLNLGYQFKESQLIITQLRNEVEQVLEKLLTVEDKAELTQAEKENLNMKVTNVEKEKDLIVGLLKDEQKVLANKVEDLLKENRSLLNKIKNDENEALRTKETMRNLEDTIQDYEITISGLKNVIDENLETLMSLKNDRSLLECETEAIRSELMEVKDKEQEQFGQIIEMLKANDIIEENLNSSLSSPDLKICVNTAIIELLEERKTTKSLISTLEADLKVSISYTEKYRDFFAKLQAFCVDKQAISTITDNEWESTAANLYKTIEETFTARDKIQEDANKLMLDIQEIVDNKEKLLNEKVEVENKNRELNQKLIEEKEKVAKLSSEFLLDKQQIKPLRNNKENIMTNNTDKENELKKKNLMLKQKLVLTENAKFNLEKRVKELREENKKLTEESTKNSDESHYKKLLQEHLKFKEEHETVISDNSLKIDNLEKELQQYKIQPKQEDDKKLVQDLQNIREAYGNVLSSNSKLELENVTLRKMIEERNIQLSDLSLIKEAYEKLLEENNKLLTDSDTSKYKRMRDKEEYVRLLKKERDEAQSREQQRIHEIRVEYENKLEKMKDKMLKLYREEVNKEVQKAKAGRTESSTLMKTITELRSNLFEAEQKIQILEMEREMRKAKQESESKYYLHETDRRSSINSVKSTTSGARTFSTTTTTTMKNIGENELPHRHSTLPRTLVEEVTYSKRTSINPVPSSISRNLRMEDEEDDLFNNKYLADLKQGHCMLPIDEKESKSTRFSELAWRNSLVPPHLKSSYPAEVQFVSPSRFKDEDLKTGQIEFDNSLCKLLPGEKARKKDFGTTSYKRPGPPTPSKNGGRLSLQGNEVHPLKETGEIKTPKRSTPNRIKALFIGKNNSNRDNSEGQVSTPKSKRLSIFRRPR